MERANAARMSAIPFREGTDIRATAVLGSLRRRSLSPRLRERRHAGQGDKYVVAIASATVFLLHGFDGALSRDLGVFVYGGEHVARGIPPYVGIFNTVGPLADAVPGLAIWAGNVVGADPVLAARMVFMVLSVGCCVLTYVLARDVFHSRPAGMVAAAVFLTFEEFIQLASGGPREKTTMLLFLLAALVLVGRRRWLAAGICTALATLAWQPSLAVAVAAAIATAVTGEAGADRARSLGRFLIGGMIPSVIALAAFTSAGALATAFAGFVSVNVLYTHQPSFFSAPSDTLAILWRGYHVSLVVFAFGIAALIGLGAIRVGRSRRDRGATALPPAGLVPLTVAGLVGLGWSLFAINGSPDLFELLPFAAIGVAGVTLALVHRLPRAVALPLMASVVVAALTFAGVESTTSRSNELVQQRADVAAVLGAAPPGSRVLSINASEVLAIAQRDNPTGYQIFDAATDRYLRHTSTGGVTGYARYISRTRPTLIAVDRDDASRWPIAVLDHGYRRAGTFSSWAWYVSRNAGHPTWEAVRAANRSVAAGVGQGN